MSKASKLSRTRGADYVEQPPVPKAQRTRGRRSTYDDAYLPEVIELVAQGATSREIAQHFDIDPATFWRWQQAYPQLRNAVKAAKDVQDERVVDALRINAVLEGNVTAQIFWLKNRQPDIWRDRKETEIIVPPGDNDVEPDQRQLALQALALFNGAVYDPEDDTPAEGLVIEGHAREEIDDGENEAGALQGSRDAVWPRAEAEPSDPDFDDRDPDFDLGDV